MGEAKARAARIEAERENRAEVVIIDAGTEEMAEALNRATDLMTMAQTITTAAGDPRDSAMIATAIQCVAKAGEAGGANFNALANGMCSALAWLVSTVEPEAERLGMLTMMFSTVAEDAKASADAERLRSMSTGGTA